jgi:hypothetical protein
MRKKLIQIQFLLLTTYELIKKNIYVYRLKSKLKKQTGLKHKYKNSFKNKKCIHELT